MADIPHVPEMTIAPIDATEWPRLFQPASDNILRIHTGRLVLFRDPTVVELRLEPAGLGWFGAVLRSLMPGRSSSPATARCLLRKSLRHGDDAIEAPALGLSVKTRRVVALHLVYGAFRFKWPGQVEIANAYQLSIETIGVDDAASHQLLATFSRRPSTAIRRSIAGAFDCPLREFVIGDRLPFDVAGFSRSI